MPDTPPPETALRKLKLKQERAEAQLNASLEQLWEKHEDKWQGEKAAFIAGARAILDQYVPF